MIMKNLAEQLRSQNWFAVAVELIVVIVGIFLALQADSWNQDRLARKDLEVYMQSLTQELANTVTIRNQHIVWETKVIKGLMNVLDALDGQDFDDESRETAYFALNWINSPPTFPQKTAILGEMQSSGMLKLISNKDLRQALGEITSIAIGPAEAMEHQRHVNQNTAPPFSATVVDYVIGNSGRAEVVNLDLELARTDPNFRLRILFGVNTYLDIVSQNRLMVNLIKVVLEMLANEGYEPSDNWLNANYKRFGEE